MNPSIAYTPYSTQPITYDLSACVSSNEVEIAGWLYPRFVRNVFKSPVQSSKLPVQCAFAPALHAYEVGQQRGVLDRPMEKSRGGVREQWSGGKRRERQGAGQRCMKSNNYTLSEHPGINDANFGLQQFGKFTKSFNNVLRGDAGRKTWIWVAPRFGPVIGPVDSFSTSDAPLTGCHPCFAARILDSFVLANRQDPLEVDCFDACPTPARGSVTALLTNIPPPANPMVYNLPPRNPGPSTTHAPSSSFPVPHIPNRLPTPPPVPQSLVRQRSPQAVGTASLERRVRQRRYPSREAQSPIMVDDSDDDAAPAAELPPLRPGIDILPPSAIVHWQTSIRDSVRAAIESAPHLFLHGKTVPALAQCLVELLIHFEKRKHEPDTTFAMFNRRLQAEEFFFSGATAELESFFKDLRLVSIGVRKDDDANVMLHSPAHPRSVTNGPGPERALWREGCSVLIHSHNYWQQVPGSDTFRPVFAPVDAEIPERIQSFRAHGTFLALHCLILRQGPLPISIWVLLALVVGRNAMLIPENVLHHLDPGAYKILAIWYSFQRDTPVPPAREANSPIRQFIINYMPGEIQPNLISNNRSEAEHTTWIIAVFATILIGHPSPWNHPEFKTLCDGFNIVILTMRFAETIQSLEALPFLVAIYNRRLKARFFAKLFQLRLEEYLAGVGHPSPLRGVLVTDDQFNAERKNQLLRAQLLLVGGSDSDLLPIEDKWRITFWIHTDPPPQRADAAAAGQLGSAFSFHTCSYRVDIYLDRALEEVLLQPLDDDPQGASKFDVLIHSQLLDHSPTTLTEEPNQGTPAGLPIPNDIPVPTVALPIIDKALYFVGVKSTMGARSLAQILCPTIPPDCSIIERLSTGLLGRILSGLDDHAEYLVGTSNTPDASRA
ncbi:hypothetical protein B0H14DRAFT_3474172 [Mycena olivaceomarginata]|nr:hypothetical protein B0H14DRAFT_3474172 [Mycena olivaceomarginata]